MLKKIKMSSLEPDLVALILLSRENLIATLNKIPGRERYIL